MESLSVCVVVCLLLFVCVGVCLSVCLDVSLSACVGRCLRRPAKVECVRASLQLPTPPQAASASAHVE